MNDVYLFPFNVKFCCVYNSIIYEKFNVLLQSNQTR